MPLKKGKQNIGYNIGELKADNMKSGKAKGAGGKVRPMKQILAIALSTAGVSKKGSKVEPKHSKKHEKMESKSMKMKEKKMGMKS